MCFTWSVLSFPPISFTGWLEALLFREREREKLLSIHASHDFILFSHVPSQLPSFFKLRSPKPSSLFMGKVFKVSDHFHCPLLYFCQFYYLFPKVVIRTIQNIPDEHILKICKRALQSGQFYFQSLLMTLNMEFVFSIAVMDKFTQKSWTRNSAKELPKTFEAGYFYKSILIFLWQGLFFHAHNYFFFCFYLFFRNRH